MNESNPLAGNLTDFLNMETVISKYSCNEIASLVVVLKSYYVLIVVNAVN